MRTVGIICEYNPFHNGHKRQIDILRDMGYDCIVSVMSGNFTQRGELSMFDKYTRAECAVLGGSDLVLELPFPYCSLSAEGFARSGVHILSSLGIKDISFGSECADVNLLRRAADAISTKEFVTAYSDIQKKSSSGSAKAYFDALGKTLGEDVALLSNDILAISYISAIKCLGIDMNVVPIKREGLAYNDRSLIEGELPSASAIRRSLIGAGGKASLDGYVPDKVSKRLSLASDQGFAPVSVNSIEREILSFFKLMTSTEITSRAISRSGGGDSIAQDGCGICERLSNCARDADSFDEFLSRAYNSKYTNARINRVILFSLLGVSDAAAASLPEYTTLLAADESGRTLLSQLRKGCNFNVVTKPADAPVGVQSNISRAADEVCARAMPNRYSSNYFVKCKPYMAVK